MLAMRIVGVSLVFGAIFPAAAFAADSRCVRPPGHTGTEYNARANRMTITYYVPIARAGCESSMQGCVATACPGLKNNESKPTCLDAVRLGQAQYVSLAGDWSIQGRYIALGEIRYRSALDNQMHTVPNVVGYVHDTGCAFNGSCSARMRARYGFSSVPRPDKVDVCTTVCVNCTDEEASTLASGTSIRPSGRGITDPNLFRRLPEPISPFGLNATTPYSALGAYAAQGAFGAQGAQAGFPPGLGTQSPLTVSPSSTTPSTPGGTGASQQFVARGLSAGSLIVQPPSVKRGGTVIVSWTSVNMQPSSCSVLAEGNQLATTESGTQKYTVNSATTFALQCTDAKGERFKAVSSVTP